MPELSGAIDGKRILNLLLDSLVGNVPPLGSSPMGQRLRVELVRLTDKAVASYAAARAEFAQFDAHSMRFSPYFIGVSHLENCVSALHRALLVLDVIRTDQRLPQIDRMLWKQLNFAISRLNDIRDAIEHIAERIQKAGNGVPAAFPFLFARKDDFGLDGSSATYRELARWIELIDQLAKGLTTPAPPNPAN